MQRETKHFVKKNSLHPVGYFFPAGKDGFSNEDEILVNVLRLDKGYSEVIS